MSELAGANENDCDTTRIAGSAACGGGVGAGSAVRFGVSTADAGGTAVDVGFALDAIDGVGDPVSGVVVTGAAHAARTTAASMITHHRRVIKVRRADMPRSLGAAPAQLAASSRKAMTVAASCGAAPIA